MSESITTAAELMGFLADARAEYDHGDGDDYLSGQINAARTLAAILAGKNDAAGWLPSWRWDEFAALIATYRPDADLSPVKPSREDVAREIALGDDPTCPWPDGFTRMEEARAYRQADAVLALLPGRAAEEVKAETLEEAASVYGVAQISGVFFGAAEYPKAWLRARAASLRGESNG